MEEGSVGGLDREKVGGAYENPKEDGYETTSLGKATIICVSNHSQSGDHTPHAQKVLNISLQVVWWEYGPEGSCIKVQTSDEHMTYSKRILWSSITQDIQFESNGPM